MCWILLFICYYPSIFISLFLLPLLEYINKNESPESVMSKYCEIPNRRNAKGIMTSTHTKKTTPKKKPLRLGFCRIFGFIRRLSNLLLNFYQAQSHKNDKILFHSTSRSTSFVAVFRIFISYPFHTRKRWNIH